MPTPWYIWDPLDPVNVRSAAARALGRLGASKAVTPLLTAALSAGQDDSVPAAAATALCQIGTPQAVEALITAVQKTRRASVLFIAAIHLGRIGVLESIDPLIAALQYRNWSRWDDVDGVYRVITTALSQLSQLSPPQAVSSLIAALQHQENRVRRVAATVLLMIYRSSGLDDAHKHRILTQRTIITQSHNDNPRFRHEDYPNFFPNAYSYSDCSNTHMDRPGEHRDTGIGIDFPI